MKKLLSSIALIVMSLFAMAQNTVVNDANAERRSVSGFTGIHVSGGIDVYLNQSGEDAVAVSASESKYRDRIMVEVKDGILKIWYKNEGLNWSFGNRKLRAYVSFKAINSLHASGASDLKASNGIKSANLDIHLSGASDFKGALEVEGLSVSISGASDMQATGKTGTLKLDASGASVCKCYELVAQTCTLEASGASDIKITVEKEMEARASGASDIRIKGNGVIKKFSSSGASSVKKV
jgi:hypothetical protein